MAHQTDLPEPAGVVRQSPFLSGCALCLRGAAYDAVGGYDPQYWAYGEDLDLSGRLRAAGWGLAVVPGTGVRHAVGGAIGRGARYAYYLGRSRTLLARKRPELASAGPLLPLGYWYGSALKHALGPRGGGLSRRAGFLLGAALGPLVGLLEPLGR